MSLQWWFGQTDVIIAFLGLMFTMHTACTLDVNPQYERYLPDYHIYHNVSHITHHLKTLASRHSDIMHIDWTYQSRSGIPQLLTRITNFSQPSGNNVESLYTIDESTLEDVPKVRVLLSYGEHAREFFPVESFFHLLKNLTDGLVARESSYEQRFSKMILSHFDIFIIVIANPDGRKIVESSQNYCWRGTSTGVDINRNFDWQFAQKGSSSNPKDEEFRGPFAFSEPECNVFVDVTRRIKFDAFFSFHTGVRHIYMPFADTASKSSKRVPPNFLALSELAFKLSRATKYQFQYGKAYSLNFYTADGTAFDYMAGVRQIPFCLALEIWENKQHKGHSCFDQFNPHSEQLMSAVEDFHPLYVEIFSFLRHWKLQQFMRGPTLSAEIEAPTMTLSYFLLVAVVCVSLLVAYKNRHYICVTKRRIIHLRQLSSTFTMGGIFR
ncbi:zinc carboxypeptidase-like [Babylonia areolata]|uniref:zinc carboxypeptidase-like n=1 Tax=Babylonia areolata TaxID=304850 RepID=UPI003FD1988B